jgi:hypothetical protein
MWLCSQLGGREHYAVPRALFRRRMLKQLATDAWAPAGSALSAPSHAVSERFHHDLTTAQVRAWNSGLLASELAAGLKRLSGWPLILAPNHWFQRRVAFFLSGHQLSTVNSRPTLFSYSYSDLEGERVPKVMAPDDGNHLCPLTF